MWAYKIILFFIIKVYLTLKKEVANFDCDTEIKRFENFKCIEEVENLYNPDIQIFKIMNEEQEKLLLKIYKTKVKDIENLEEIRINRRYPSNEYLLQIFDQQIHDGKAFIFMELTQQQNLKYYMKNSEQIKDTKVMMKLILNLVKAINFIHSFNIVHSDLNTENIYIDENGLPKIGNFNRAKDTSRGYIPEGNNQFIDPWIYLNISKKSIQYSIKQDIYSIGMVFYLLVYKKLPYENLNNEKFHLIDEIMLKKSILIPKGTCTDTLTIIDDTLKINPNYRASLYQLEGDLMQGVQNTTLKLLDMDIQLRLDSKSITQKPSYLDMFSEMLFVGILVFCVIPLTVFILSRKIQKTENEFQARFELEQQNENQEQIINY